MFKALVFFSAIASTTTVQAAVVVDQSALVTRGSGEVFDSRSVQSAPALGAFRQILQTFTVGRTGTLARIDVQAFGLQLPYGILTLYNGVRGTESFAALGTYTFTPLSLSALNSDGLVTVDVSGLNLAVAIGDQLSIGMSAEIPATSVNSLDWVVGTTDGFVIDFPNVYEGGFAEQTSNSGGSWTTLVGDAAFRTHVNVVPEPASWALLIAGFGLTGAVLRRRRASFAV